MPVSVRIPLNDCLLCDARRVEVGDQVELYLDPTKFTSAIIDTYSPVLSVVTEVTTPNATEPAEADMVIVVDIEGSALPPSMETLESSDLERVDCFNCCDRQDGLIEGLDDRVTVNEGKIAANEAAILAQEPKLVPAGGAEGLALIKTSGDDYDADWADPIPDVIEVDSILLKDTSAVILPPGSLGGDANLDPVSHDGVTTGGRKLAFIDIGSSRNFHVGFNAVEVIAGGILPIGGFSIPAKLNVAGQQFLISGKLSVLVNSSVPATSLQFRIKNPAANGDGENYGTGRVVAAHSATSFLFTEIDIMATVEMRPGTFFQVGKISVGDTTLNPTALTYSYLEKKVEWPDGGTERVSAESSIILNPALPVGQFLPGTAFDLVAELDIGATPGAEGSVDVKLRDFSLTVL